MKIRVLLKSPAAYIIAGNLKFVFDAVFISVDFGLCHDWWIVRLIPWQRVLDLIQFQDVFMTRNGIFSPPNIIECLRSLTCS